MAILVRRGGPVTSGNLAPYTGLLATRTFVPWNFSSGNVEVMSRSMHVARTPITSLQVVFPNWYVDGPNTGATFTEIGTGASATITASIEYPVNTMTQLLFGGSASGTAPNLGNLTSDALSVTIPGGAQFFVRVHWHNAAGILYNLQGAAGVGDHAWFGASVTDQTMSGTVSNFGDPFYFPPLAIIGRTTGKTALLIGTSRVVGVNDTHDTSGDLGIFARAIGPNYAYINAGVSGDSAAKVVASHALRAALATYCSHVLTEHGVNDVGDSLATQQANLQSIWNLFPTKRVYASTESPERSSTDSFATLVNQSGGIDFAALNDWIRTKPAPLTNYFEVADVTESSRNSHNWRVNGTANWYTSDGLHESQVACLAIQSAGVVAI